MFHKLQYISQGNTAEAQLHHILKALDSGCEWIQLRWKNASPFSLYTLAEKVKQHTDAYSATLIINDYIDLAREMDCDGVHLGLSDMSIGEAKAILGDQKIIGGTANTYEHVLQRMNEHCDYIGLGPLRFTTTKQNLSPLLGLKGYTSIMKQLKLGYTNIPIYAIGGIKLEDIESLINIGIYGIAISGILTEAVHPKKLVSQLNRKLYVTT
jgi:thiamine-phosphate pyrophosphorylase